MKDRGIGRSGRGWGGLVAVVLACLCVPVGDAPGQSSYIEKANDLYATIRPENRADLILFPACAAMDQPPATALQNAHVSYVTVTSPNWAALAEWAAAPAQQAALEALRRATEEVTGELPKAIGLGYGIEAAELELVEAGAWVDLGDPPLLVRADFRYFPLLDNLVRLVNVEVTRLAAEGRFEEAFDLLVDLFYLGRQMADRGFVEEVKWGLSTMVQGLQRLRDVAYSDFRSREPRLTTAQIKLIIDRLDDEATFFRIDRIRFPQADLYAAQQLHQTVFIERDGPSPQFASIMAGLESGDYPLRMFAEAGKWEQIGAIHRDWFDTRDKVANVHGDWVMRWSLPPFDPRLQVPYDYEKLDPWRDAVVRVAYDVPAADLFELRRILRTEIGGTRTALAILAFRANQKVFPPTVFATRPQYVKKIDDDPFNPSREHGLQPEFNYFVPNGPNSRPLGEREEPMPHRINVITMDGANFSMDIDGSQFIVYSVGPDGRKDWATNVRESALEFFPGDYLIWPPVISLHRQHLLETGQLQ